MKLNITVVAGIIFVLMSVPVVVCAQFFGSAEDDLIKSRSYIGAVGISATIDQWDDFAGTHFFQFGPVTVGSGFSNPEIDAIPAIERNFGWGILAGHREGPWAAEISYWQSNHAATFIGGGAVTFSNDSSLQSFDINIKRYFLTQLPTQPFVSLGVSFPWLWFKGGSMILDYQTDPDPSGEHSILMISDESISGVGFNLGAGMEIYLGDNYSILGGIYQRWSEFTQINGATKLALNEMYFDNNPNDLGSLAGKGLSFYLGATIGFQ
jgi:hypothetical protein